MGCGEPMVTLTVPQPVNPLAKSTYWNTLDPPLHKLRRSCLRNDDGHRHLDFQRDSRSGVWPPLVHAPHFPPRYTNNRKSSQMEEVIRCRGGTWPRTSLALIDDATDQPTTNFCPGSLHRFKVPTIRIIDPPRGFKGDAQRCNHLAP